MPIYCDSVILMCYFDHTGPFNVRATSRFLTNDTRLAAFTDLPVEVLP